MITIKDYIDELREAQSTFEIVRSDLDRAIERMKNEDITGSHTAALAGIELLKLAQKVIKNAVNSKIF